MVTGEPIAFLPNVCVALHHFMLDVYKKDLKGRKAIEETIMAQFGLKAPLNTSSRAASEQVPSVADAPDEVWFTFELSPRCQLVC